MTRARAVRLLPPIPRRTAISSRTVAVLAGVAVLVVLSGLVLATSGGEVPGGDPDVTGTITAIEASAPRTDDCVPPDPAAPPDATTSSDEPPVCDDPAGDPLGTVLVEEDPAGTGDVKISFRVDGGTQLLRQGEGTLERVGFDALDEGAVVSAWSTGELLDSYPQQATARAILILPTAPSG
jgi:hypothetical protein